MRSLRVAVVACVVVCGCNRRVFAYVEPVCGVTDVHDVALDDDKADILVVVDNSGSMQEEQDEVARSFLNDSPDCPIPVSALGDFRRCDDDDAPEVCRFLNPSPAQRAGELAACGFLQVLAAYDTDFHIGVITTDVGACDNRAPSAQGGDAWGFRPQRGCLQPDMPFGARKIITRDDLDSVDADVRDVGGRFARTLDNIRTFGTPVERGLDAVDMFFDPAISRAPSCANDREGFLRDDARLVVLFLTDEQDCSRFGAGPFACAAGDDACVDRFAEFDDDVCGEDVDHFFGLDGDECYVAQDTLTAVGVYAQRLQALKDDRDDVRVAVIAGGVVDGGGVVAGGCDIGDDGAPAGGCEPLDGRSPAECPDCCLADGGSRYFALADAVGGLKDSICNASFRRTLVEVAALAGASDDIEFRDVPTNPDVIVVEQNGEVVDRLDGGDCDGRDGWVLLDERRLRLCGRARPAAGDDLRVRAPLAGLCAPPLP